MFLTTSRVRVAAAFLVAVALLTPAGAAARTGTDPRAEREQVREQQAATASDLDALRATDAELQDALRALNRDVRAQEAAVEDTQREVAQAQADVAEAEAAQRETQSRIDVLEAQQQTLAVDSYMRAGSNTDAVEVLGQTDLTRLAERRALIDLAGGRNADLADELAGARQDLLDQRAQAEEAAQRAVDQQQIAERKLARLGAARTRQQAFAADVDQRIESRLAEAAGLEQIDSQLSAEIAAQQAALIPQVPSGSLNPIPSGGGNISLVTVGGIQVAASIGDQVGALLSASRAAGLSLGGSGYRSSAAQAALRQAHCPDPANSPPSDCSPPTARPGSSLHEQGLAIDFTNNRSLIRSHSDAGYVWLAANAGTYGLHNLPSEPWHWSTTGG